MNRVAVTLAVGVWIASSIPGAAAALSWDICTKNEAGQKVCKSRVAKSARIAIAIACLVVLILLGSLIFCIIRSRRATAAAEAEYNVEACQVDGPPTIIATSYHPTSGPSGVYSGGGRTPPEMKGPSFPVAAQMHYNEQGRNYTAPVSQSQFDLPPYPFTGHGPDGPSAPKTAFVNGAFPRPLLTGNRLKDRLKERPASNSSLATSPVPR